MGWSARTQYLYQETLMCISKYVHIVKRQKGYLLEQQPPLGYSGCMQRKRHPYQKSYPQPVNTLLDQWMSAVGRPEQAQLIRLWQHWPMVMGPELAGLAWPLGHRNTVLLVGGEDAMAMQELSLQSGEILERVNAFLDEPLFNEVRVSLALGKNPLDSAMAVPAQRTRPMLERGPAPAGLYLELMDANSAVARCYARFAEKKTAR